MAKVGPFPNPGAVGYADAPLVICCITFKNSSIIDNTSFMSAAQSGVATCTDCFAVNIKNSFLALNTNLSADITTWLLSALFDLGTPVPRFG